MLVDALIAADAAADTMLAEERLMVLLKVRKQGGGGGADVLVGIQFDVCRVMFDVCCVLMMMQEMSVHKAASGLGLEAKDSVAVEAEAQRSRLPSAAAEEEVGGDDTS